MLNQIALNKYKYYHSAELISFGKIVGTRFTAIEDERYWIDAFGNISDIFGVFNFKEFGVTLSNNPKKKSINKIDVNPETLASIDGDNNYYQIAFSSGFFRSTDKSFFSEDIFKSINYIENIVYNPKFLNTFNILSSNIPKIRNEKAEITLSCFLNNERFKEEHIKTAISEWIRANNMVADVSVRKTPKIFSVTVSKKLSDDSTCGIMKPHSNFICYKNPDNIISSITESGEHMWIFPQNMAKKIICEKSLPVRLSNKFSSCKYSLSKLFIDPNDSKTMILATEYNKGNYANFLMRDVISIFSEKMIDEIQVIDYLLRDSFYSSVAYTKETRKNSKYIIAFSLSLNTEIFPAKEIFSQIKPDVEAYILRELRSVNIKGNPKTTISISLDRDIMNILIAADFNMFESAFLTL